MWEVWHTFLFIPGVQNLQNLPELKAASHYSGVSLFIYVETEFYVDGHVFVCLQLCHSLYIDCRMLCGMLDTLASL